MDIGIQKKAFSCATFRVFDASIARLTIKTMKKFLLFIALALSINSCEIYTSTRDSNPREDTHKYLRPAVFSPLFSTIKITDFFDRYQDIRDDEEAVSALMNEYYTDLIGDEKLTPENFSIRNVMIHRPEQPDTYIVNYADGAGDLTYYVTKKGDRSYEINTIAPMTKFSYNFYRAMYTIEGECTASVDDEGNIIIDYLDMTYTEAKDEPAATVHITSTDDPVMIHMSKAAEYNVYPFSGVLNYDITGKNYSDSFRAEYKKQGKPSIR